MQVLVLVPPLLFDRCSKFHHNSVKVTEDACHTTAKRVSVFFYFNEGDPREPAHNHVMKAGTEAKFWLEPVVKLARNDGFDSRTVKELMIVIRQYQPMLLEAWNDYFS